MTAVEYLIERMTYIRWMRERDEISRGTADNWAIEFANKAKEMEKEQTVKFGIKCQMDFIKNDGIRTVDDIYNETYGDK